MTVTAPLQKAIRSLNNIFKQVRQHPDLDGTDLQPYLYGLDQAQLILFSTTIKKAVSDNVRLNLQKTGDANNHVFRSEGTRSEHVTEDDFGSSGQSRCRSKSTRPKISTRRPRSANKPSRAELLKLRNRPAMSRPLKDSAQVEAEIKGIVQKWVDEPGTFFGTNQMLYAYQRQPSFTRFHKTLEANKATKDVDAIKRRLQLYALYRSLPKVNANIRVGVVAELAEKVRDIPKTTIQRYVRIGQAWNRMIDKLGNTGCLFTLSTETPESTYVDELSYRSREHLERYLTNLGISTDLLVATATDIVGNLEVRLPITEENPESGTHTHPGSNDVEHEISSMEHNNSASALELCPRTIDLETTNNVSAHDYGNSKVTNTVINSNELYQMRDFAMSQNAPILDPATSNGPYQVSGFGMDHNAPILDPATSGSTYQVSGFGMNYNAPILDPATSSGIYQVSGFGLDYNAPILDPATSSSTYRVGSFSMYGYTPHSNPIFD